MQNIGAGNVKAVLNYYKRAYNAIFGGSPGVARSLSRTYKGWMFLSNMSEIETIKNNK